MTDAEYRKSIIKLIVKMHNLRSLKLIYEYVEYLLLHHEVNA